MRTREPATPSTSGNGRLVWPVDPINAPAGAAAAPAARPFHSRTPESQRSTTAAAAPECDLCLDRPARDRADE